MRLGSFLLFTLIASVVLAVSSIPVKGWSRPGQGRGQFKLTGGVTKKKPRVRAKKVTVQTIATVTLLDGKTGEISTTGVPLHSQLQVWLEKQIFEEIFGLSSRSYRNYRNKIEWKGLYDPSPSELLSRQWLYFNITEITGIEDQTNKKCPCFGWTAKGPKNVLKPGGSAVVNNKGFKQRYIGISPGKQAPNYFEGKWGKPVSKTADLVIDALGKVWETLLAEFKAYFIAPRVTFISGIDGEPLPGPDYTGSGLNAAINGALHRGPNDRIIYHGPYLPFPGNQPSVLFKLAAVGQCTETSPCLGWIAQGVLHPQMYMGIVKEHSERSPPFIIIGMYPPTFKEHHEPWSSPQPLPPLDPLGEEWLRFMKSFGALPSLDPLGEAREWLKFMESFDMHWRHRF